MTKPKFQEIPPLPIGNDSSGMKRVSQYQVYQRGVDTRSGNLIVPDSSFPRVLLGNQLSGGVNFYGMKVSKEGYDVNTATDDQLVFNSSQNVFKIVSSGTIQETLPGSTGFISKSAAHGLGYTPLIIAFIPAGGSNYLTTPFLQFDSTSGINIEQTRVEVDSTNVYLKLYAPSSGSFYASGFTRQAKYYLLRETAD